MELPDEAVPPTDQGTVAMEIDEGIVMQLVSIGFDMEGCKKAVFNTNNQGGEEGGREGGRQAGREGGREAGREAGREEGRQGGRQRGREGGREGGGRELEGKSCSLFSPQREKTDVYNYADSCSACAPRYTMYIATCS